jgi:hypothetical protein
MLMVNCLNWECEGAFVAVQLIQLSRHSYLYRGYYSECPRNPFTFKHSYRISSNGDYYGRDFALAEAMRTVDQMYKQGAVMHDEGPSLASLLKHGCQVTHFKNSRGWLETPDGRFLSPNRRRFNLSKVKINRLFMPKNK